MIGFTAWKRVVPVAMALSMVGVPSLAARESLQQVVDRWLSREPQSATELSSAFNGLCLRRHPEYFDARGERVDQDFVSAHCRCVERLLMEEDNLHYLQVVTALLGGRLQDFRDTTLAIELTVYDYGKVFEGCAGDLEYRVPLSDRSSRIIARPFTLIDRGK